MAIPASTQTVLTVVVGGSTSHIAYELDPFDFQIQNKNTVPSFVTHKNPMLSGLNMELQNLPPPSVR